MAVHARKAPPAHESIRLEDVHQRATLCFSPVGGKKHGVLYEAEPTGDDEILAPSVEIPVESLVAMISAAIEATGYKTTQIVALAEEQGLFADSQQKQAPAGDTAKSPTDTTLVNAVSRARDWQYEFVDSYGDRLMIRPATTFGNVTFQFVPSEGAGVSVELSAVQILFLYSESVRITSYTEDELCELGLKAGEVRVSRKAPVAANRKARRRGLVTNTRGGASKGTLSSLVASAGLGDKSLNRGGSSFLKR